MAKARDIDPNYIRTLRVLLVDDVHAMRILLRSMLQSRLGVSEIREASCGELAIERLAEQEFDLLITDIAMQPVDGFHVVEAIRRGKSAARPDLPIIAVTAYSTQYAVRRLRDLGVHEVLTKPLSITVLEERIRYVFERPRPWVQRDSYSGPDRRRRRNEGLSARDARSSDGGSVSRVRDSDEPQAGAVDQLLARR